MFGGVADDDLDGLAHTVGLLVNRNLILEIALELAVARELEFDQGLVERALADLEVHGAATVIHLSIDVELGPVPNQAEEDLDVRLPREWTVSTVDYQVAVVVLDVVLERLRADERLLIAAKRQLVKAAALLDRGDRLAHLLDERVVYLAPTVSAEGPA